MRVQTLRPEPPVGGLDEGIVGLFAGHLAGQPHVAGLISEDPAACSAGSAGSCC